MESEDENTGPSTAVYSSVGGTDPTIFSLDGCILIFPVGIQTFCIEENAKAAYIDEEGGIFVLRNGETDWREVPSEATKPAAVTPIKRKE